MIVLTVDEMRIANYNTSCQCRIQGAPCKMLIEKGSQYNYVKESRHKYMVHEDCYLRLLEEISALKPIPRSVSNEEED